MTLRTLMTTHSSIVVFRRYPNGDVRRTGTSRLRDEFEVKSTFSNEGVFRGTSLINV